MKIKNRLLTLAIATVTLATGIVGSMSVSALPIQDSNQGVEDEIVVIKTSISKAQITIEGPTSYVHTNEEIKPTVSVKRKNRQGEYSIVLTEGTDFEVTYENNVEAGTATVTATGIEKYKDSVSTTFEITHDYSDEWTVDLEPTNKSEGSKSHHCVVEGCDAKIDVTPIPATNKLEGTVYHQLKMSEPAVRYVAEVNIEDVEQAETGEYVLTVGGEVADEVEIFTAYKSLYANGEVVTAPEGKCYIITSVYNVGFDGDVGDIEIAFSLDLYEDALTRVYTYGATV